MEPERVNDYRQIQGLPLRKPTLRRIRRLYADQHINDIVAIS